MASEFGMAFQPDVKISWMVRVLAPYSHLQYFLHNAQDKLQARKSFTISIQPETQTVHCPGLFSLWFDLMIIQHVNHICFQSHFRITADLF